MGTPLTDELERRVALIDGFTKRARVQRAEAIEAALRELLTHFEAFGSYIMLRTALGEMPMPDAAANSIRAAWAALGETPPGEK